MILKKMFFDTRTIIMALTVLGLISTLVEVYGQEDGMDDNIISRNSSPRSEGGPSAGTTGPIGDGSVDPSPDAEYKILLPYRCQEYDLSLHGQENVPFATLPAKTCFEIREYPSEIVGVYAQQWVQGNKVYDGTLSSTSLFGRGDPYHVDIYSSTIEGYKVRLIFYLDTQNKEFTLQKSVKKDNIYYTNDIQFLGTWASILVKWFTINIDVNDIEVEYNEEDTNFIQNLVQKFKVEFEKEIKEYLAGPPMYRATDVGRIEINFTEPYP